MVEQVARYNRVVSAFERTLDGQAAADVDGMAIEEAEAEPDQFMWRAAVLALAGRESESARALAALRERAPAFVEVFRQLDAPDSLIALRSGNACCRETRKCRWLDTADQDIRLSAGSLIPYLQASQKNHQG